MIIKIFFKLFFTEKHKVVIFHFQLRSLIEKSYARKLQQGRIEQVMAALYRRGFPAAAVRAAVREYQEQADQQEDF